MLRIWGVSGGWFLMFALKNLPSLYYNVQDITLVLEGGIIWFG